MPPVVLERYPDGRAALQLMVMGKTAALMSEPQPAVKILPAIRARGG
jgi:hypothetical protein